MSVEFTLNGRRVRVEPRPDESLLETLRERCGIRSLKDGCSPQGQCGCCLALIDGHAKVTCAMTAASAAGREVLTLEGLPDADRRLVRPRVRAGRRRPVRLLHPGHRPAREVPPRPAPEPDARGDRARDRRPPLPVHRLHEDRRRDRVDGARPAGRSDPRAGGRGRRGRPARALRRGAHGAGRAAVRRRPRPARIAARRAQAVGPRARARPCASTPRRARALPGRRRGGDCRRRSGRALVRPDRAGLARLRGRGRRGAVRGRRRRRRRRGGPPHGASRGGAGRGRVRGAAASPRPARVDCAGRAAGQPATPEPPRACRHPARRCRRRAGGQRPRRDRHLADAADRAPVPRARERARRAAPRRPPAPLLAGPGDLRRSPAGGRVPGAFRGRSVRRAGAERRRVRRQGGHVGAGADGAAGAADRPRR